MQVTVAFLDAPELAPVTAHGRNAWALLELYRAGDAGCTPLTHPGPRWSGYVHKLRRRGVRIDTIPELWRAVCRPSCPLRAAVGNPDHR